MEASELPEDTGRYRSAREVDLGKVHCAQCNKPVALSACFTLSRNGQESKYCSHACFTEAGGSIYSGPSTGLVHSIEELFARLLEKLR